MRLILLGGYILSSIGFLILGVFLDMLAVFSFCSGLTFGSAVCILVDWLYMLDSNNKQCNVVNEYVKVETFQRFIDHVNTKNDILIKEIKRLQSEVKSSLNR